MKNTKFYNARAEPLFCSLNLLFYHVLVAVAVRRSLLKGAMSRVVHLEKFSLNFSSSSFAIHVNLLHP